SRITGQPKPTENGGLDNGQSGHTAGTTGAPTPGFFAPGAISCQKALCAPFGHLPLSSPSPGRPNARTTRPTRTPGTTQTLCGDGSSDTGLSLAGNSWRSVRFAGLPARSLVRSCSAKPRFLTQSVAAFSVGNEGKQP